MVISKYWQPEGFVFNSKKKKFVLRNNTEQSRSHSLSRATLKRQQQQRCGNRLLLIVVRSVSGKISGLNRMGCLLRWGTDTMLGCIVSPAGDSRFDYSSSQNETAQGKGRKRALPQVRANSNTKAAASSRRLNKWMDLLRAARLAHTLHCANCSRTHLASGAIYSGLVRSALLCGGIPGGQMFVSPPTKSSGSRRREWGAAWR